MILYSVNDKDKKFRFNNKHYKTPCTISVIGIRQIDQLNKILKQNNIIDISVQNLQKSKSNKTLKKISSNSAGSKIVLSAVITKCYNSLRIKSYV